jgi:hypothetical protein
MNCLAAAILLCCAGPALAVPLLAVDIDDRSVTDTPNSVPGFSSYTLNNSSTGSNTAASSVAETRVINGYTVTIQAFDDGLDENNVTAGVQNAVGQIDDRDRTGPTDSGAFTYAQIYDDLIFAGATTGPTGGLDLRISGGALQPNTSYLVSLYSFDAGSNTGTQPRTANYLDGNNGDALVTATSFNGTVLPTTNNQYRFTGTAMTDSTGALFIKGRNTTGFETLGTSPGGVVIGVILNGFEINPVPEPATATLLVAGALGLTRRRRRA